MGKIVGEPGHVSKVSVRREIATASLAQAERELAYAKLFLQTLEDDAYLVLSMHVQRGTEEHGGEDMRTVMYVTSPEPINRSWEGLDVEVLDRIQITATLIAANGKKRTIKRILTSCDTEVLSTDETGDLVHYKARLFVGPGSRDRAIKAAAQI